MRSKGLLPAFVIALTLVAFGILLAGCANTRFASMEEAAKAFPRAEYQVLGKTRYDQLWIDTTIEAEVAGFGFARPARRPAALGMPVKAPVKADHAVLADRPAVLSEATETSPSLVSSPAKTTRLQRLKQEFERFKNKFKAGLTKYRNKLPKYQPRDHSG